VLRKIFGPQKEELTKYCQKCIMKSSSYLLSLAKYYSNNRIKEDKTSGACGMLGEKRNACSISV
jgi:hypothetical protein